MTSIETSTVDPARMITRAGEGERLSFLGMDPIWKVTSETSRGAHVVFAHDAPPGVGVPLNVHRNDEETLHVVRGRVLAQIGDVKAELGPGDIVNLPRGVQHGWRVVGDEIAHAVFAVDAIDFVDPPTMP